jgi:hypothetical protein
MRQAILSTVFFMGTALAGCDLPRPILPPLPPHGGTAFARPDGKGFVEVLRQETPDQPGLTQLLVYFLDAECMLLPSAATAASFQPKDRGAAPVALKPTGNAEPPKVGRLASAPFRNPGEIVGVLSATVEGTTVSVAINLR